MIRTLRMSRKGVQVEVEVGVTKYGSPMTVTAHFTRADLEEALRPLDEAVTTAVRTSLEAGRTQEILDELVAATVAQKHEQIKRTARLDAEAAAERRIRDLERELYQSRAQTRDVSERLNITLQAERERADARVDAQ